MAGETAKKYLALLDELDSDGIIDTLQKLRNLPIRDAEDLYNEAVRDYIEAKLSGKWE